VATGIILIAHGVSALADATEFTFSTIAWSMIALVSGVSVLLGFLTPLGSVLAVLFNGRVALAWVSQLPAYLAHAGPIAALVAVMAAALAFLGPGAFSMDSRLFGRREIIIPRPPKP
jgi:uncharacterized membrane protein YphA (DoxX/SURF4 family)